MEMTATHVKNNFGTILKTLQFEDIIVKKNGRAVAKISAYSEPLDKYNLVKEEAVRYETEDRKVSYEEFLELVEASDERYELINGEVYMLASPRVTHQMIVGNIHAAIHAYLKGKDCRPFVAPFDITLEVDGKKNVVQPDVGIICDMDEKTNDKDKYMGVPTLAVEVLSPSTRTKDMVYKLNLYMLSGISEFWVVDPEKKLVISYEFMDNEVKGSRTFGLDNEIESMVFEGLNVQWY